MSIRFAAPSPTMRVRTRPSSTSLSFPRADNDDGAKPLTDTKLAAALRHFADHGLSAGQEAYAQALVAFDNGDEQAFVSWRDICEALDRRLARKLPTLREFMAAR